MGSNRPLRIMHVIGGMYYGGKETLIMNVYKKIDRTKIQFDFIVHTESVEQFHIDIENMGGRVFYLESLSKVGTLSYIKKVRDILLENGPYLAVHSHMNHQSGINSLSAWLAKIKIRISHVHATNVGTIRNRMLLPIYKMFIYFFSTDKVACSIDAGIYNFGKMKFKKINNGIDVDKFINKSEEDISKIKETLELDNNSIIIGHVGRFIPLKNHKFLLLLLEKLLTYGKYKMVFVGDGPYKDSIIRESELMGLKENVYFMGEQKDIHTILNLFDIFLLPSKNEGLGIVLIEAQAAGKYSIASDTIPKETDMGLGLLDFCSLDDFDSWINLILNFNTKSKISTSKIKLALTSREYDSLSTYKNFMKLYGF